MPQQNENDVPGDDLEDLNFDHALWDYPQSWPHDPPGHVFLARTFNEVGRSHYGQRWRDSDWDDAAAERSWENDWDDEHEPKLDDDNEKWLAYQRTFKRARLIFGRERAQIREKRAVVARTITRRCELGTLITAVRPIEGGQVKRLDAHFWNTELIASRFFRCDMSLTNPFEPVRSTVARPLAGSRRARERSWIYVTHESLKAYLTGKPRPGSEGAPEAGRVEVARSVTAAATVNKRGGRTPGSGSFDRVDEPLLEEMHALITDRKATSPREAAGMLADKAWGNSTVESKQTRLAKRYRQKYGAIGAAK
jgi:hypothetical protein